MANTTKSESNKIERRDFIKKSGTMAGAIAAGFPGIISAQTVTNAVKIGVIGCGGRGTGAAAQALTADPNNELTAVADIEEAIVERAAKRLASSEQLGPRVKIDHAFFGLDAYEKVINSGVDVVVLATPPGFRPQHLTAAVNANKHVFCEKPCATDSPGVREVMAAQKLAQTKNLALVAGFCWRYNNMTPGDGRSGQKGRHRQARCALFDVLHESGEAHAARKRAPRRHERRRVADSELVQLHMALR